MHDLPNGAALLALARDVLLGELLPFLPEERRLDARLVANAMAIAEREVEAGDTPASIVRELETLYNDSPHPNPPPQAGEGGARRAGDGRVGVDVAAPLLSRFARDLRASAFTASPERERAARAILWHLTIAQLRAGNPRFLAANGLA